MSPQNNFELFSEHLRNIADNWEPLPADRIHPVFGYRMMANNSINLLKEASPQLPEKLTNSGVYHGARVIGQYCHIAALVSKREGYSKEDLVQMLQRPTSFNQLAMIARQPNKIAGDMELRYGLGPNNNGPQELVLYLHEYEGSPENGLMISGLLPDIINAREWLSGHDEYRMCPAQRLGQLSKIYGEFVKICAKDPMLFDTTLRDSTYPRKHQLQGNRPFHASQLG